MTSTAVFAILGIATIAVIAFVALGVATRRKKLKCPDCGTVFPAPAVDLKRSGLGWTFPYTGVVKCPKCGETRGRRDYQKAPANAPPST
jgi:predicted RNA-binding Zn-ribbon protein involved in translation (DUF1610 family)